MRILNKLFIAVIAISVLGGCVPALKSTRTENKSVPVSYNKSQDTSNTAKIKWKEYFNDPDLAALIDTALKNNQELNIILQEIEISKNEIKARKGEYLPFVNLSGGAGFEKAGRYTRNGAVEDNIEIKPGTEFPEPLGDFGLGVYASWEIDIWKKLRNAKKAATTRYLASIEGRNFMVTNLVAEIASSYYELMTLDNQLDIIQKNIEIQNKSFQIIKQEKEAAKVTQLAVNRFEAQLLNTQNLQYDILQKITETENRINFLTGRFPQPIPRNSLSFTDIVLDTIYSGIPSQLLQMRTDVRQAELELTAAKLDIKVAKANFYPSFKITAGVGLNAFNPAHLINPQSLIYNLAGELVTPLVNRNAIKATYYNANAKQIQAVYNYERTILNAHLEVANQLSGINNFAKSFDTKSKEVEILNQSVTISNNLYRSARADYMEVLLTQREALESKIDLIEIKMKQMRAKVNIYKALGGGWN
ncbi:MAG: Outer membrane protein OprM [Bacteroidia bacterium]|nr:Outer membrane protein OprM [Bacteroidia bacterium]